ncbi:MAG TPA: hypothetical protein VNL71_20525 [Chloroflexota bacterium]|nr:hypothetical protein [Chloroflexota bacterium]
MKLSDLKPAAEVLAEQLKDPSFREEWERKTKRSGNLAEWFSASPLRDSELGTERLNDPPREIEP